MRPLYAFALGGVFGAIALGALWWQHGREPVTVVEGPPPVVERAPAGVYEADAGQPPAVALPPTSNDDPYQLAQGDAITEATPSAHADAIAMGPPGPAEPRVLDPAAIVAGPPPPTALDEKVAALTEPAPTPSDVTIPGSALLIPVEDVSPGELTDTFTQARAGGARVHDAIDIMAPAGKKVFAVADGKIEKLFLSEPGGLTIYQFDADAKYAYYYAHLQSYAPGLAEGQLVKRGDVIGYVGSTGNADPKAPHLHFAIMQLGPDKRWWEGVAINPYPLLAPPNSAMAGGGG